MNKSCNGIRRASWSWHVSVLAACLALQGIADASAQTAPAGTTTSGNGATANGDRATAVGENALADQADATTSGAGSAALGAGASAYGASSVANAYESVALGYRSFANDANGTVLGANASAFGVGASAFGSAANTNANYATAGGYGAVAAGVNSAAFGANAQALGAASVAVGGQAVNEIGKPLLTDEQGQPVETAAAAAGIGGTAVGASAKSDALGASAYGLDAGAAGVFSTALGTSARAAGENSLAAGFDAWAAGAASVALGSGSTATAANSVALGAGSQATRTNTVAVGSAGAERQITHVAAGAEATDAVNLGQFQSALGMLGGSVNSIYAGLGDLNSRVAALSPPVAPPVPDAASNAQVQEALATARNYADAGDRQTLGQAKAYTDQKTSGLASRNDLDDLRRRVNDQFNTLDTRINRVGAIGVAMSLMSSSTQGFDGNSLGVAVGGYRSQAALSVGFSRQLSARARLTLGTAIAGGGETAGGVGLGIGL